MARDWPLIGRERELALISAVLGKPESGGVVLAGRSGVGKTRLATECQRIAEQAGFVTARAVATRAAASIPFGAFAQLLPAARAGLDSLAELLRRSAIALLERAGDKPLMLIVDDAHLLDEASATLLHQVAAEQLAFVVVTVRTREPAPDSVVALWKDGLAERIEVGPITLGDAEVLVAEALGGPVEAVTLKRLATAASGNPLFLREIVLAAVEADALEEMHGVWQLKGNFGAAPRLVELVEARLKELDGVERKLLELVSFGEPLGLSLVTSLIAPEVIESLERKELVSILEDGGRLQVGLAHPLHGEVVRAQCSALAARSARQMLADAVEDRGSRRREDVLRVASWRLDGGGTVRPDIMLAAAEAARLSFDLPLAERIARLAIAGGAGLLAHRLLAEVIAYMGDPEEGERILAGLDTFEADPMETALIALTRSDILFWGLGRYDDAVAVNLAAEKVVSGSPLEIELACQRANCELQAGRPVIAAEIARPALEPRTGRAFVTAAIVASPALALMGHTTEAMSIAEQGFAEHTRLRDEILPFRPGNHQVALAVAQMEAGLLLEAEASAQEAYDQAVAEGAGRNQAWAAMILGRAHLFIGHPRTARRRFTEAAAMFAASGQRGSARWCIGGQILASAALRDLETAVQGRDELDGVARSAVGAFEGDVIRARGWVAALRGDTAAAVDLFGAAAANARESGEAVIEAAAWHDVVRFASPPVIAGASARLEELAQICDGTLVAARYAHARAMAADDGKLLDDAAAGFAALPAYVWAASCASAAAAAHRRAGIARAAAASERRAAMWLEETQGARVEDAGRERTGAEALTKREREVATLAALGRTNKELAGELFLSERTIENHLQRVYDKLGVSGRAELAAALGVGPEE